MYDLSELKQADTADLKIRHPKSGDETGWVITFAGPGHPKAVKQKNAQINRGLKRARMAENAEDMSADEVEQMSVDYIVGRMVGWSGLTWEGEKDKAFDEAFVKKLLGDPSYEWLKNACNKFLVNEANFIGGSPKA